MNVSLTPELEAFVTERVASGRFQSASEVIRHGLRLLEKEEESRQIMLHELRAKIATGLTQARRGDLVDGESWFEEVLDKPRRSTRRRAR